MKPKRNKYAVGGMIQAASSLSGLVKDTLSSVDPLLPRDPYGNKTLRSHVASGIGSNIDKGMLGQAFGALSGFLTYRGEQKALDNARTLDRAGYNSAYAMGGPLYPINSNLFPEVNRLGGSWNSYNILNQKALGGPLVNMERELERGQEVEMEHKPTLEFIKKYYKEHSRFPSAKKVAKSITIDHIKDFQKVPNRTEESYYKGLIENNLSDEVFQYALGGFMHPLEVPENDLEALRQFAGGGLVEFGNGGTHEENPYGGIPVGMNPNGQPNLVEEGETRWQDYIFSDRLKVHKPMLHGLPDRLKRKTFAEASKILEKESKERPYDRISQRGREKMMNRLMESSEMAREIDAMKQTNQFATGGLIDRFGFSRTPNLTLNPLATNTMPFGNTLQYGVNEALNTRLDVPKFGDLSSKGITGVSTAEGISDPVNINIKPKDKNKDWLNNIMRYSPVAYNALAALTMRRPEDVSFTRRGEGLTSRYGMQPQYVDETIGLGSLNTGYRSSINALRDASAGNAAAYRASLLGSIPGYLKGREGLYSQLNALNLDQYSKAAQHNAQLGVQGMSMDANLEALEEDINARNLGAYKSNKYGMMGEAVTGLSGIGSENYWGEIAPRIYDYDRSGRFKPNQKKCGGRMKLMKRK